MKYSSPAPARPRRAFRHVVATFGATILFLALTAGSAAAVPPDLIISDSTMRAYDSMSVAQIQAYLNTQTGPLKTLVTSDYDKTITISTSQPNINLTPDTDGVKKPASQIIWEACQQWKISPKVMLTMLQKEQSLLTRTSLTSTTLARAIGAGCPNGTTNKYPGFGNQIWHGARLLDGYGEGKNGSTVPLWTPGLSNSYTPDGVHTATLATYKLYVYNPSITGNTNFYNIYLARFGDPTAQPIAGPAGAVFRFYNTKLGSHFYTVSAPEANTVQARYYDTFKYEGVAYISTPAKNPNPLYRFFNMKNGAHFYTASEAEMANVRAKLSSTFKYEGPSYTVSLVPAAGSATVYRFFNTKNGTHFYTASVAERDAVRAKLASIYSYEGPNFYVTP